MFDVANWVARLNGENGCGWTPSHEALSVSPQGALEISSVIGQPSSLDRNHFSTPRLVAKSHKRDERRRPSSQRPQYPSVYKRLKRRSVARQGKRLHINVLELKAVSLALQRFMDRCQNQTVLVAMDNSTVVASINKQGGTHSAEMGAVNRMVTASAGVQTDLSQVVHPSCRSICHSSEPQTATVHVSSPRPKCLGHRCSKHKLVGLTAVAYPLMALLHRMIQKIRQCNCLIIVIAPGWPGMLWFLDLVQLSTEIPLQLPVSTTLLKQSHNYVFHSNPQHLNLHVWCLGVDDSRNKASLWRWQRELLSLRGHQQEPSINQSGSYLKKVQRKFGEFLHSLCETSLRLFHVPVPRP